jgi:uncharacterized membrane protein YphA (DoxX/SURF4 family)
MALSAIHKHPMAIGTTQPPRAQSRAMHVSLWVIQALLALLFVFAGSMKFIMPVEELTKNSPLPAAFFYFIGVAEVLGGFGLVLPSVLRIREYLTPLAAAGLTIIMVGAVSVSLPLGVSAAAVPFVVGALTALVAHRRWKYSA